MSHKVFASKQPVTSYYAIEGPTLKPGQSSTAFTETHVHATTFAVLFAVSFCHLLNDMMQSLMSAIYPQLKESLELNFAQVGLISATYQLTASMLQPVVGYFSDKRPMPFSLPVSMSFTMVGLVVLSQSHTYALLIFAAALVGLGSAIFHPESSRVARMASGGRFGLAQSLFQVGGNLGQALGPLMAAAIVATFGQGSIAWFALMALLSIVVLFNVGRWYKQHGIDRIKATTKAARPPELSRSGMIGAIAVLMALIFSKQIYFAAIASYYTFYLIERFGVSLQAAQLYLFVFLAPVAIGTLAGGLLGDRFGRKHVIWFSVLGIASLHIGPSIRRPVLDRRAVRLYRPHIVVLVPRDRGLRAGTDAAPRWCDFRPVFRLCVRSFGHRRRGIGLARGLHEHRIRLPDLLGSSGAWAACGVLARSQGRETRGVRRREVTLPPPLRSEYRLCTGARPPDKRERPRNR